MFALLLNLGVSDTRCRPWNDTPTTSTSTSTASRWYRTWLGAGIVRSLPTLPHVQALSPSLPPYRNTSPTRLCRRKGMRRCGTWGSMWKTDPRLCPLVGLMSSGQA
eukprot:PhF_6_TR5533/c0_g1_i1/m.7862